MEFICRAESAPHEGEYVDYDFRVVNVSHDFPEDGFSYEDMRAGRCKAFVRVTCERDEPDEPEFEAYTFDERTGSERVHQFYTAEARDKFLARQPQHLMAH